MHLDKQCSCCKKWLENNSYWMHKMDPPIKWAGHSEKEYLYHKCKQCCLKDIDSDDIKTILPLFEEFNVPYIKEEWERIHKRYPDNSSISRYLALMKLRGFYEFQYEDSDRLNEIQQIKDNDRLNKFQKASKNMMDIRRKKVKAIYFNAFHCPECGLELHKDNIVLTTYPAQYCYYCDCGFRITSFQQPGYEYEFEDEEIGYDASVFMEKEMTYV